MVDCVQNAWKCLRHSGSVRYVTLLPPNNYLHYLQRNPKKYLEINVTCLDKAFSVFQFVRIKIIKKDKQKLYKSQTGYLDDLIVLNRAWPPPAGGAVY